MHGAHCTSQVTEPRAVATGSFWVRSRLDCSNTTHCADVRYRSRRGRLRTETGRYRSLFCYSFARIEAISDPRFGENVARLRKIRFDLLSQLAYEYPQVFILLGVIAAPYGSQQRPMCQNLSGIAHEVNHQVEFFRR